MTSKKQKEEEKYERYKQVKLREKEQNVKSKQEGICQFLKIQGLGQSNILIVFKLFEEFQIALDELVEEQRK